MAEQQTYLIIGNGIAGATAVEILRNEDSAADITLIADDPGPVYYRPALKDYLGGKIREEKLWARPISFYQDRRVRLLTDRVVGIEAAQHRVLLRSGQSIDYSRLLLAHGARASTLTCPGLDLLGVTTLRTVADYQRVLSRLNTVRRVVVTGSGTLALESIETLRHRGLQVTHLLRRRALWSEVLDPTASDLVLQQEKRDGVDVRYEQEIAEIQGKNGQVTGIVTTTGVHIACELVLLGIGIEPLIDFVKSAGIACGRGVKVDRAMHTNVADIYAAGDLIETPDPLTGRSRVIGQWYPAIQQARAAAYSMLDLLDVKHSIRFGNFYNASILYGLEFASVGLSTVPKDGQNYQEIVADPQPRVYQKAILKNGVVVGMLALGDRRNVMLFKRAVDAGINLSSVASRLFAPDFKFAQWLNNQDVPEPVLGVSREGAMAIKKAVYTDAGNRSAILKPNTLTVAVLVAVSPPELVSSIGGAYLSQTKVVTIGRQEGVGLLIKHGTISRRHAEVSYANGQYVLRDVQSRNGTFVNGTRLEAGGVHVLTPNEKVRFGDVTFTFQLQEASAVPSALFRKQKSVAPANGTKPKENSRVIETEVHGAPTIDEGSKTLLVPMASLREKVERRQSSSSQPVLNADGSLLLPGALSTVPADVVASMKATPALVVILQGKPEVFLLKQGERFILGRDKDSRVVLADMSVSRKHAEVFSGPNGFYMRDLASSNGVVVNQATIDNLYRLSNGDHITIGNINLYYIDQRPQMVQSVPTQSARRTEPASAHSVVTNSEAQQSSQCSLCGAVRENLARFCSSCGAPL
nr:FAD-dependent oxidoreductase [Ktedonobacteraceae bacterium]